MGVKILSLFDGMACGMIAMQLAGVEVESYDAYEIDKYAIKTAQHNFPMIKEHGDVFDADFTQYEGVDFLIGGSPCTYWSIAQTKNRETVASGMGWELFSQYVRALHEAKPKYFIYENNKSMSKDIRASIDKAFGFEAVLINSALVSAQNRQRLYWVGKRNEDGTYSKVNVEQPADRGILLKDVLDSVVARDLTCNDKSYTLTASYDGACAWNTIERHQRNMVAEPIEPRCVAQRGRYPENPKLRVAGLPTEQMFEAREDEKTNTLTTVQKDNLVAEPINVTANGKAKTISASYAYKGDGEGSLKSELFPDNPIKQTSNYVDEPINVTADDKAHTLKAQYYKNGIANFVSNDGFDATAVAEPVGIKHLGSLYGQHSRWGVFDEEGKAPTLTASAGMGGGHLPMVKEAVKVGYVGYAIEFDDDGRPIKAIGKDGKEITVYEVTDGKITIKGKQYPIKLKDGYYIIRKLTVRECMRLQTVPEWYEFPVSNSQAYKMLGNGWTCEVICHLINSCFKPADVLPGQIGLWG